MPAIRRTREQMDAQLMAVDDPRWSSLEARADLDFYHRAGYLGICGRYERADTVGVLVENGRRAMLLPLLLHANPDGSLDAASPHGYPGAMLLPDDDPAFFSEALEAATDALRHRGVVSMYVRLHPLLNQRPPTGIGQLVEHPPTVAVDLALPEPELWRQTRPRVRSQINRSVRAGHRVRVSSDAGSLETFAGIYRATMERVGAAPSYRFDDDYFAGLARMLGPALHVAVVEVGEEAAAAGLWVETAGIVHLHLVGAVPRFDREQPTKRMYHEMRTWARQRGARWLHLGGGRGRPDDTLLRFKAAFSSLRRPYRTLRAVVDEERYSALVAERFPPGGPAPRPDWFPAHRAPLADDR